MFICPPCSSDDPLAIESHYLFKNVIISWDFLFTGLVFVLPVHLQAFLPASDLELVFWSCFLCSFPRCWKFQIFQDFSAAYFSFNAKISLETLDPFFLVRNCQSWDFHERNTFCLRNIKEFELDGSFMLSHEHGPAFLVALFLISWFLFENHYVHCSDTMNLCTASKNVRFFWLLKQHLLVALHFVKCPL